MEFIKDQEKRILLSALSREKKVINEHEELAELIPVINQLDYYFMYDRLFKRIYNQALEELTRQLSVKFIELPLDDLIVADILNDVKGICEQLKK